MRKFMIVLTTNYFTLDRKKFVVAQDIKNYKQNILE